MKRHQTTHLVAFASGIAAGDPGCADGPLLLQQNKTFDPLRTNEINLQWDFVIYPPDNIDKLSAIVDNCKKLAEITCKFTEDRQHFIVLAGDHSCAIGTWSGVSKAVNDKGPIGLIWVDAHLDSHTFETTESGNIHGMPLACLMGFGDPSLTHILTQEVKVKPEHVCIIGARSFESGEEQLIKRLGVRVYYNDEIKVRGLNAVVKEARDIVQKNTVGYGISIDLDAVDPIDAPGVGTPELDGISGHDLCEALRGIMYDPKLLGLEIVEFNPHHDKASRTEKLIFNLVKSLLNE